MTVEIAGPVSSVSVLRRSDSKWSVCKAGELILPDEPIRLYGEGVATFLEFRVEDASGNIILEHEVGVTPGFPYGYGWLDWVAPTKEGIYYVFAVDSYFPFIRRPRHEVSTYFEVSRQASEPPPSPPGGVGEWLKEFRNVLLAGGVLLIGYVAISKKGKKG